MRSASKKQALVVILLLVTVSFVASAPVEFNLAGPSEVIKAYRYRIDDQPWLEVTETGASVTLPSFDADRQVLFVQTSDDGLRWSEETAYRYDRKQKSWIEINDLVRNLKLTFKADDPSFIAFRYQMGTAPDGTWIPLERGQTQVVLPWFDPTLTLFIQRSKDGKHYSGTYAFRYVVERATWELKSQPRTDLIIGVLTPYGQAMKTALSTSHVYDWSFGGGLHTSFEHVLDIPVSMFIDISAAQARSTNVWVDTFSIFIAEAGLAYRFAIGPEVRVSTSIAYGVAVHSCEEDFEGSGNPRQARYVDQQLEFGLAISWPLTAAVDLYLKPKATVLIETDRIGLLYGIAGGLQLALGR